MVMNEDTALNLNQLLKVFHATQRCLWCIDAGRPAKLTMKSYLHSGGILAENPDGSISRQWVYGVCESCEHQWSLQKLQQAWHDRREERLAILRDNLGM